MDIQRQAFEKAFKEQLGATHYQFDCDENGDYEDRETLCGWLMWQQAQKVAVPEGFVLVEKSKINTVVDALILACDLREADSNYEDALNHFHKVAQSLGEAQEQVDGYF